MRSIQAVGYYFTGANQSLEKREFTIENWAQDKVVVEVAGCGLCHTDITFYTGAVKTKHDTPLILGHEVSGKVVAAGSLYEKLMNKNVVVPAVLPCGECELCKTGRDNICQKQLMPGNDFQGGFASYMVVPGRSLCELPGNLGDHKLAELSIVADAVTTPYQSLIKSGLKEGHLAVVIGVGGIGIYMVQHAKNAGAKVIALDINEKRLEIAKRQGADFVLCVKDVPSHEIKKKIRGLVKENSLPSYQWRIFEMSGTGAGQEIAYSLLSFAGVLGIVGFTMEKAEIRLSNIMAFDADVFGNWGCRPCYYGDVVKNVLRGKINIRENLKTYPLDSINDVISQALEHKLEKRAVLVP